MAGGSIIGGLVSGTSAALFGKRMIIAKSQKDLEKMRAVGESIAEVREELRRLIVPGVTTLELNAIAEKMMRDAGSIRRKPRDGGIGGGGGRRGGGDRGRRGARVRSGRGR